MPAPCKPPPGSSQPIAGALPSRPGNASGRHPASVRVLLKTGLASVALMLFNFYLKVPRPSLLLPDSSALPTTHAVPAGWKRGVSIKCISGRLKGSVRFFSGNSGSIVARGLDCQSNMLYLKHFCLIIGSPHLRHAATAGPRPPVAPSCISTLSPVVSSSCRLARGLAPVPVRNWTGTLVSHPCYLSSGRLFNFSTGQLLLFR